MAFAEAANIEVMHKYLMSMKECDITGEGSSSICRKGIVIETNMPVAIKTYKDSRRNASVSMTKFQRQISVLQLLMEPLVQPEDPRLWCDELSTADPADLFMQLIDFSKLEDGTPGLNSDDNEMYVVTELASYSLKDFVKNRRRAGKPVSQQTMHDIVRSILLVTAGLHAKLLCHLDLKPENLMLFSGRLKLIDVDGCVQIGETVTVEDSSLSFSPCYCAPEWAAFVIEDTDLPTLVVDSLLDVWSIGMTICELVTLEPTLKRTYASFMQHGRASREAGYYFLEWLASVSKVKLPREVANLDPVLEDMLINKLLVADKAHRASFAECFSHKYLSGRRLSRSSSSIIQATTDIFDQGSEDAEKSRIHRKRPPDVSTGSVFEGTLFKLSTGKDPQDRQSWLPRDFYISDQGNFCYWSLQTNTRLVVLDGHRAQDAEIVRVADSVRGPTLEVRVPDLEGGGAPHVVALACESEEDLEKWIHQLGQLSLRVMQSIHMGKGMAKELRKFRVTVKNRRLTPSSETKQNEQILRSKLWKVKTGGNRHNPEDWLERDMWLTANGNLVYHSKRDDRDLMYFTAEDLAHAKVSKIVSTDSAHAYTFQVTLQSQKDVEYSPSEFAAETEELREEWLKEIVNFGTIRKKSVTDLGAQS
eukprot:TRINITY_DN6083_c0_g1_i2.p1 TRINITY_DN6083_c0_g1~~TRINITY_DN6083_c0_g1_i2.p1  ORF type:complete len:646 (+),score=116.77 TRINITY_DN6083_c0_g1_i2:65-2002(+)